MGVTKNHILKINSFQRHQAEQKIESNVRIPSFLR